MPNHPAGAPAGNWRLKPVGLLIALLLLLGIGYVCSGTMPSVTHSMHAVADYIRSWGAWSAAIAILLMVLHCFVPFPAEFVGMANGMLFGPLWGAVVTWSGAMLGAWLAFGLARALGRPFLCQILSQSRVAGLDQLVAKGGIPTLLFSRFVPVISFNLINYAAGLTAMSWWSFTWATALGILPLTLLVVLAGDGMVSGNWHPSLWLAAAAAGGWFCWWLLRRAQKPRDIDHSEPGMMATRGIFRLTKGPRGVALPRKE